MRCYVGITPDELQRFLNEGSFIFPLGMTVTQFRADENPEADEEELEFEVSWIAALESRDRQSSALANGYALALEIPNSSTGSANENGVEIVSPVLWEQVEALLVADSDEMELSWFAPQEVSLQLPAWLS